MLTDRIDCFMYKKYWYRWNYNNMKFQCRFFFLQSCVTIARSEPVAELNCQFVVWWRDKGSHPRTLSVRFDSMLYPLAICSQRTYLFISMYILSMIAVGFSEHISADNLSDRWGSLWFDVGITTAFLLFIFQQNFEDFDPTSIREDKSLYSPLYYKRVCCIFFLFF